MKLTASIVAAFLILFVGFVIYWRLFPETASTPTTDRTIFLLDWTKLGALAPSVLPELERTTRKLIVEEAGDMAPYDSPKVLPPYNPTMTLNYRILGMIEGKSVVVETNSDLVVKLQPLKAGMALELDLGRNEPQFAYDIRVIDAATAP